MAEWLVDASANRHIQTYVKGFIDISGSDLSGNALTVRNGTISVPNNSIPSSAVVREVMLLTSTGTSGYNDQLQSIEWDIYGSVNMLADTQAIRSYGTSSQVYNGNHTVSALTMLFNAGVYKVTISGRKGDGSDETAFGFDLDNDNLIGYMNTNEELQSHLLGGANEAVSQTYTYVVPHTANFHWVERSQNTWANVNAIRVQLLFERIGNVPFSGTDDTLSGYGNIPISTQRDIAGGLYWSSTVTKPTDPDEYLDLNESGTEWIYRIS
jgi:hypothetical protein